MPQPKRQQLIQGCNEVRIQLTRNSEGEAHDAKMACRHSTVAKFQKIVNIDVFLSLSFHFLYKNAVFILFNHSYSTLPSNQEFTL